MSKQVLRSSQIKKFDINKYQNIYANKTYIANNTDKKITINSIYNSINIVSRLYDGINFTETDTIRIGTQLKPGNISSGNNSIYIGSNNGTTNNTVENNVILIGNNNGTTNNIKKNTVCIGNNNFNLSKINFVIGNKNSFNTTSVYTDEVFIVGSSNSYETDNNNNGTHSMSVIGNFNYSKNRANNIIGNFNTLIYDVFTTTIPIRPSFACGLSNYHNGGTRNSIIGNINIFDAIYSTTVLGNFNKHSGELSASTIIGNSNGSRNIQTDEQYYTCIGNFNNTGSKIGSYTVTIGNFNESYDNGSNSICIGNYNKNSNNSILLGSGIKNEIPESIIINTFSTDYINNDATSSKLKIICPFGSNISNKVTDKNKIFFDSSKNRLFYNIID